ncbi:uncharacterized protein LOC127279054 isoform X2 [Leptopilina boulardi]|uniref:uncharacterized protein LOC127279054 isoform X2 n=1 Tax=Leptopilina boulardi TaxID=63433 RepID=UPI0021F5A10C|nr:uncharacterized protein LOC127279054 isoform X2 [Leptopilina boulardi]
MPKFHLWDTRSCTTSLSTPGVTVIHVLSKLWDLRNDYVAELRKVQLEKKRNSLYRPRKKWFYTMHQFLYHHLDSDEKPSENSCEEENLSECCEDKVKGSDIENGHFSKSRRKLFQDSTFEELEKKTDKFLTKGSKRGQCTSSSFFKCRHQDQEYRSNNLQTSKLWVPTSLELRRSTPKPTSSEREGFSCCSNCSCCSKTPNWENPNISEKFNLLNSNNDLKESKCGTCNQIDHLDEKERQYEFEETVIVTSSDSLCSEKNNTFEDNQLNNVRRVLCLDELSDHVTKALNEMFMKLCPVDIACFNSYCSNETCRDVEKNKEEKRKSTSSSKNEKSNFSNPDNSSIAEVTNEKENRQSVNSSQDKTTSVEDDNFSQFGTEVARLLKESNREKALRLKAAIKQTLESAKEEG